MSRFGNLLLLIKFAGKAEKVVKKAGPLFEVVKKSSAHFYEAFCMSKKEYDERI